ncbi:MAG TPA: hypothetical protein VGJ63_09095 [Micromonosporaceae bacterium]
MQRALASVLVAGVLAVVNGGCGAPRPDSFAPLRHPFRGVTLLRDRDSLAAEWQAERGAPWLDPISSTP